MPFNQFGITQIEVDVMVAIGRYTKEQGQEMLAAAAKNSGTMPQIRYHLPNGCPEPVVFNPATVDPQTGVVQL